jgi:hypothetical protein
MDDGLSDTVVPLRYSGVETTEKEIDAKTNDVGCAELLPTMPDTSNSQTFSRRAGGPNQISEKEVLRSGVHGEMDGRKDQSNERQEQPKAISETGQVGVRAVLENKREIIRPPHRRESAKQLTGELENIVWSVSQAIPLAVLEGDEKTCEAMLRLFPQSWKTRPLPGSLSTYAEAWEPPSVEEVERAWKAGHFENFRVGARSPIKAGQEARHMRLHGYGNAIVPEAAAEFIRAYLEA